MASSDHTGDHHGSGCSPDCVDELLSPVEAGVLRRCGGSATADAAIASRARWLAIDLALLALTLATVQARSSCMRWNGVMALYALSPGPLYGGSGSPVDRAV